MPSIGFIHLVPFDRDRPRQGHLDGIELFAHAERLGIDSGWVRTRHMQYGLSAPAVFLAAAAQHTERLQLGTAVIPVGFENPYRLAEDLATLDVISGGRVQAGLSVHAPNYGDANDRIFDTGWREQDYGYGRIERLREHLSGARLREIPEYAGFGGRFDSERVEPQSAGLARRLWYGGGSLKSAAWAGAAGMNWLVSNITTSENGVADFSSAQRAQIDAFRAAEAEAAQIAGDPRGAGRVTVARVIVPLDGTTAEQERKYRDYAEARTPRTRQVMPGGVLIARDMLGTADEIVDMIANDPAFQAADDYVFELPFEFELADWKLMLEVVAEKIGPAFGWTPGA